MKRLIVCCDGTWQHLEKDHPTNVVKLAQAVQVAGDDDNIPQLVYYDEGVGAEGGIGAITRELTSVFGGAFGRGIDKNIMDAYRFLVLNYTEGDEIYLFGFSRGAYTVRSLAGFIGKSGLLQRRQLRYINEAYEFYRHRESESDDENVINYREFKDSHNIQPVKIHLLGCWDTVGSLGIPDVIPLLTLDKAVNKRYRFHDNKVGSHIENVLHACAIDEERNQFMVTLADVEDADATRIQEVWFPGDHSAIGGGVFEKRGLSDITLKWMLDKAGELGLNSSIEDIEVDVTTHFKQNRSIIEQGICEDHTIYINNDVDLPFTPCLRDIQSLHAGKNNLIKAIPTLRPVFHDSVYHRWRDCRHWWQPENLTSFKEDFNQWLADNSNTETPVAANGHLAPQQSVIIEVNSEVKSIQELSWNIEFRAGESYSFEVKRTQVWQDGNLPPCTADGWNTNDLKRLRKAFGFAFKLGRKYRKNPEANWFELVGEIVEGDKTLEQFRIGSFPTRFTPRANGRLFCYANDQGLFYFNNDGCIRLKVTRIE